MASTQDYSRCERCGEPTIKPHRLIVDCVKALRERAAHTISRSIRESCEIMADLLENGF